MWEKPGTIVEFHHNPSLNSHSSITFRKVLNTSVESVPWCMNTRCQNMSLFLFQSWQGSLQARDPILSLETWLMSLQLFQMFFRQLCIPSIFKGVFSSIHGCCGRGRKGPAGGRRGEVIYLALNLVLIHVYWFHQAWKSNHFMALNELKKISHVISKTVTTLLKY